MMKRTAALAVAVGAMAVTAWLRRRRRVPEDMRLVLKRRSRFNRAYLLSLPPIERPK